MTGPIDKTTPAAPVAPQKKALDAAPRGAPPTIRSIALHHIAATIFKRIGRPGHSGLSRGTIWSLAVRGAETRAGMVAANGTALLARVSAQPSEPLSSLEAAFPGHVAPLRHFERNACRESHITLIVTLQVDGAIHRTVIGIPTA